MAAAFFGELYRRSTLPFLSAEMTAREVDFLVRQAQRVKPGQALDVGCGHGRHLVPFEHAMRPLGWTATGVDFDEEAISQACAQGAHGVVGDFAALPFEDRSFSFAWSWYSSLATFSDADTGAILREVARVLQPGASFWLETVPVGRVAKQPSTGYEGRLPDGCFLKETGTFDPKTQRDQLHRELQLPDGRRLEASFFIRYHTPSSLQMLLESHGFRVQEQWGGLQGEPVDEAGTTLIVGATRE